MAPSKMSTFFFNASLKSVNVTPPNGRIAAIVAARKEHYSASGAGLTEAIFKVIQSYLSRL